jgi:hypothetical protein
MPAPRDRAPHILEQDAPRTPLPPLNVSAYVPEKKTVDVRWTCPAQLSANTKFDILGVNIYRSFDSEFGPWFRINNSPVGSTFWRDKTQVVLSLQENVSNSFIKSGAATDPEGKYIFNTKFKPIIIYPSIGEANCTNLNVQVTVNGVSSHVERIWAADGAVELCNYPHYDVSSQQETPAVLPSLSTDVVLATYKYISNEINTNLARRIFYRLTTVAYDSVSQQLIETPLERAARTNNQETEKLDYIWAEAIRRNSWILYQGGERVKVFIRKTTGPKCGCYVETHGQSKSDCLTCFNTGVIGGYSGAYDIIIAPDDAEKSIRQSDRGRSLTQSYDTWTSPTPLLSQRDFIVKLNGDRYGIGPVRMPTNRGMQLQQHFMVSHLDEQDIRYKVPIPDSQFMESPQTRHIVSGTGSSTPMMTEKATIPDEREIRSSSITGENVNY